MTGGRFKARSRRGLACRGNLLFALKRYADASSAFDRALALKPDLAQAWVGRGKIFFEQKRYDEALAAYERALELQPKSQKPGLRAAVCTLSARSLMRL